MGNFYSAGYDPVFYIHHANVDRMWKLWKDLRLPGHVDPKDDDWLNASYVFYDENEDLVRVYNKDCVDVRRLKYDFIENSDGPFPWRKSRPPQRRKSAQVASTVDVKTVEKTKFPVRLDKIVKVSVKRPAVNRSEEDKEKNNEVLLIKGIKYDSGKFVKFDVFVNDKLKEGEVTTPCDPEYAGGFAQIPHNAMKSMFMTSSARFGLNELLEDTNTEGDEYAMVTLVPRTGCEDLTVGQIKIELVPIPKA
ncbi:putative catechol oxidase [Helianthus annuus]|nr:putative catechol oxidase [Helianthus annuus]